MRFRAIFLISAAALLPFAPATAAERGILVTASELKAKPFIDAQTTGKLAKDQKVNVLGRQSAFIQVEANGQTGWVRMAQVRPEAGSLTAAASRRAAATPAGFFTGSTGKQATTGIKGVDEEAIRAVTAPDMAAVASLGSLAVDSAEATSNAQQSGLQEHSLAYLKDRK